MLRANLQTLLDPVKGRHGREINQLNRILAFTHTDFALNQGPTLTLLLKIAYEDLLHVITVIERLYRATPVPAIG